MPEKFAGGLLETRSVEALAIIVRKAGLMRWDADIRRLYYRRPRLATRLGSGYVIDISLRLLRVVYAS